MLALPILLAAALAADDAPRTFAVAEGSTLAYHLVHRFHSVNGRCGAVEGRARWLADGTVQVVVRARVDAFDSGNSNRDAHMMEVTEAGRLPYVQLKAEAAPVTVASYPTDVTVHLRGVLEFHGVARPLDVDARVRLEAPDRAQVEASFPVSLTAHGVKRPSLLFIPVDDRLDVTARLVLRREAQ